MHKPALAEGPWSLSSYLAFGRTPEGSPAEVQVRLVCETPGITAAQAANHPTRGLYYIREHVQISAIQLLQLREGTEKQRLLIAGGLYMAQSGADTSKQIKQLVPAALANMETDLKRATEAAAALNKAKEAAEPQGIMSSAAHYWQSWRPGY